MLNRILIPALCTCALLLGCGKKERPLEDLSAPELRQLLDSLLQVENSERKLHRNIPVIVTATIKPGEGLFQVMQQAKLDNKNIIKIISALSDSVELTKLRVGEKFQVGLDPDNLQRVLTFRYSPNPALAHFLILGSNDSLVYKKMDKPTTLRHRLYKGVLENGSSLDATLRKVGINSRMVQVVNGVLMCKVSFSTNAHPGDQFEVLIEERVFQDSIWIEGQVVYASFRGKSAGFHEAFHYDDGDPKSTFNAHYTESGEALVFSGLRYPLDRLHISSAFGMRLHPVLGRREMHWGVDYSSPAGTPVFSVAEGIVIESGFDPASGNKVAVRHKDNTSSWYLHLSSRSVSKGQRVGSRQIVGRVGSTGRSTGPHLHFGFKQPNGAWMSPLSKRMIATPKLEGERFSRLKQQIATIRALLLKNRTPKKPA